MKIRRFVADSFQEALNQAKLEMGREAIILHSRKFKQGGFLGLFAKQRFEVTVAVDEDARTRLDAVKQADRAEDESMAGNHADRSAAKQANNGEGMAPDYTYILDEIRTMKEMVEELRVQVAEKQKNGPSSRRGQALMRRLTANQVDEKVAARVIKMVEELAGEKYEDGPEIRELERKVIAGLLKKPRPIENRGKKARVVALIGPTGVGKTTTIAKLAANFSLLEKKKVALVTVDTYRIAAVDQLKTYAEILGIPLEVVFNPEGFQTALKKFASYDFVFIDTAGRSPRNEEHLHELARFLEAAHPDEIILVLSATTRTDDLLEIYRRFKVVRIDKIIFTKLDETNCYGQILSVICKTRSHISYITNGQNVPDDIMVPDEMRLASLILGEEGGL